MKIEKIKEYMADMKVGDELLPFYRIEFHEVIRDITRKINELIAQANKEKR